MGVLMRHPIWKKDDFFEYTNGPRIDMDPAVCDISAEEVPLVWNFDMQRLNMQGRVMDLRLEDGEITGVMEYYDEKLKDEVVQSMIKDGFLRFGGYYVEVQKEVIEENELEIITSCVLAAVAIIAVASMPGWNPESPTQPQ